MIDRYSRKDMAGIWNLENKYRIWLEIELRVCDAWARRGVVSEADLKTIREKARFDLARIEEVEKEVQHDVIAFLTSVREFTGAPGRFIHHGMTSSDVGDTALCMQMVQSIDLILGGVDKVIAAAHALAVKYKTQIMVGRTHGIHAEPVTLGFKFAHFYAEMKRSRDRLVTARREIAVGKMSGAVGTFSNIEPDLEEEVLKSLGLEPDPIATQVVSRDRHAAVLSALAVTAGTLGRIAQEIRLLQKSEGREVEEPFSAGQKGSSAMPHKRNPVICERICGLARVVQSNVQTAYADMSLWHERDISHSSAERVIIPDSFLALDYILERAHYVLSNLNVYPDAMEKVLGTTRGLIFSQRLLLALVESGLPRDDAYRIVQEMSMRVWADGRLSLRDEAAKNPDVAGRLGAGLDALFDHGYFLRNLDAVYARLGIKA